MNLDDALKLGERLIYTGNVHQDYARVTELAEDYRIFITGKDIDKKLIRIASREDEKAFIQRVLLTNSITPAVASSLKQPFNKVGRNDRIRKDIKIAAENRQKIVNGMISKFYGSAEKKNRGLDYWMKTKFRDLQFIDPNTWVVIEWDAVAQNQPIQPRPFEVSAHNAVNFFVANDQVRWLFVRDDIKVEKIDARINDPANLLSGAKLPNGIQPPFKVKEYKDGNKYTLYDEDYTIVFEEVNKNFQTLGGYNLMNYENDSLNERYMVIKSKFYLVKIYQPKLGFAPAFRIGYKGDDVTHSRTFVNPWHDALCFFEKSLKTVSELDLTMSLHVFPQKIQYVGRCPGESKLKTCNRGYLPDGKTVCGKCRGTGKEQIHTSAQDIITVIMPDDPKDMIDLEKIMVTKSPPIELVKLQNDYVLQLEGQAHNAVFNSTAFIKKTANKQMISGDKTATEVDANMQGYYDTLEPYTEKWSELWIDFVITFGLLSGESINNIHASHDFPSDFKLKTSDVLLYERKSASESGAPSFLLNTIDDDLASITYAGDGLGLQKYRVMRKFQPFSSKSPDEIALLTVSQYVPIEQKVLYSNFDQVFKEIEFDNPEFWVMVDLKRQRELVAEKVDEIIERLREQTPVVTIDTIRGTNPANTGTQDAGGSNSGNNNSNDDKGATDNDSGQQNEGME